ncbi:hypothetical protein Tco_0204249 [Tanacetum coccineum]
MWQQWRTTYPNAYSALDTIADDPQNITSQVRQLILMEDPYMGSTDEQDRAYRDLDRITCEETKNLWSFLEDFRHLIEESFKANYPGLNSGVLPAIKFTHTFVSEMCKDAALAKELRDFSLCSAIPIPSYYKNNKKKYGMRKSRTYKGKPHNSYVKPFKRKYKVDRGRVKKLDFDDSIVYSITEGEGDTQQSISVKVQDSPFKEVAFMLEDEINEDLSRLNCPKCQLTTCALCARNYLGKTVNVKGKQPHKPEEEKDFSSNEKKEELWQSKRSLLVRDLIDALKIIDQLKAEQIRLEEQKDEEIRKLRAKLQKKKEEETEV